MTPKKKNHIQLDVEGIDETGALRLGDPASLVMEGWLSGVHDPSACHIALTIGASGNETEMAIALDDFMSANGPFLCQIDFEAEVAGQMSFIAALCKGNRVLAEDAIAIRVLNPQRDPHGQRRKAGPGALKVEKKL